MTSVWTLHLFPTEFELKLAQNDSGPEWHLVKEENVAENVNGIQRSFPNLVLKRQIWPLLLMRSMAHEL